MIWQNGPQFATKGKQMADMAHSLTVSDDTSDCEPRRQRSKDHIKDHTSDQ